MANKMIFTLFFLLLLSPRISAQQLTQKELTQKILQLDSLLFQVGFNQCNISQFENLLSENLNFYHDKDGISNKTKFLSDLKNGICNNSEKRNVQRKLVADKTEIFPLYKNGIFYGALHNGEHLFSEKRETVPGIAKFSNLWLLENGQWKLTESFSYDHQPKVKTPDFDDDAQMEAWLNLNTIRTLGLGIINDGKLKQVKVFGEISSKNSAPYNTIFNVASLTKPITAMVAMQLINSGKWNLDEPLYHYFTDADIEKDPRNKKLTTRLVLSHQTGFPNWRYQTDNKKLKFISDPGSNYTYSGEGFEYLRKAIEAKFKTSLNTLAKQLVFNPLKMKDTDMIWSKNTDESRFAIGYDDKGNPLETVKNLKPNAADDLLTTIEDYGNFLAHILNGAGLSEKYYQEMLKPQTKIKENQYFSLGFVVYDLGNGEFAISHGGADDGTQCIFFLLPQSKKGIIIFTNSSSGSKIYEPLLLHYLAQNGKKLIEIEMN